MKEFKVLFPGKTCIHFPLFRNMRFHLTILTFLFSSLICFGDNFELLENNKESSSSDSIAEKSTSKKDFLDLKVYIPLFNSFYKMESAHHELGGGTLGIGLNADFHQSDHSILRLTINSALNTTEILWLPMELGSGTNETYTSAYFGISKVHHYKRLQFGYGLSFSRSRWTSRDFDYGIMMSKMVHSYNDVGFLFPINYQLGKRFFIGVDYRPSILQITPRFEFKYEHLIELCIGWKYSIKKQAANTICRKRDNDNADL